MIIAGFDVEATVVDGVEDLVPGVATLGMSGSGSALNAPSGHPDGRVYVWTVPARVRAITFQVFGASGQFFTLTGGYTPADYAPPIYHSRNWPVSPGDEVVLAAGGPHYYGGSIGVPTKGNGPIWGGYGGTDSMDGYGGAGGGASALWINGELIALGPGGGGWGLSTSPETAHPPSASFSTGSAGSISRGAPASGFSPKGGGGGGAPGGAGGSAYVDPGENGDGVPCSADGGGPTSPEWLTETSIEAEDRSGRASGVAIWYYIPPPMVQGSVGAIATRFEVW